MIELKPPVTVIDPPSRVAATRTGRKVALCGSHSSSLVDAPWNDPSWEFWGHASSRAYYRHRMDRYFDLHPKACWTRNPTKANEYPKWLARNTVPVYMQQAYPEVPASIEYPKRRVLMEFSDARGYFTNHAAWMIALALLEGFSTIGLFGINYSTESEYMRQRGSAEYWLGRASGAGVRVILPEQCTLLREPAKLYGYESHDETTGALLEEYKPKVFPMAGLRPVKPGDVVKLAEPPEHLKNQILQEEQDYPRPSWAIGPLPGRTDGEAVNG